MMTLAMAAHGTEPKRIALDGSSLSGGPEEVVGKDGFARIRKLSEPLLELYPAPGDKGTVIVCPGGGYAGLAVGHEGREVARWLNAEGWDAVVLLYHVSAGEQTRALALADAKAALNLVQTRGEEYGLSRNRIGAMGFSAGGHLSARLAHEAGSLSFVVLIYPAYLDKEGQCLDEVAPVGGPVFLYVAEDDKHAPASFAYDRACRGKGIFCDFHHPPAGGHGFGLKPDRAESVRDWPEKLRGFLGGL